MPNINTRMIQNAERWIHRVAMLMVAPPPGSGPHPGTSSYGDFCAALHLGSPYQNTFMDLLLAAVVDHCAANGWPDLASLVIHDAGGGLREGPGDGWYEAHGFIAGDIPIWRQHRDDCWARAASFTP